MRGRARRRATADPIRRAAGARRAAFRTPPAGRRRRRTSRPIPDRDGSPRTGPPWPDITARRLRTGYESELASVVRDTGGATEVCGRAAATATRRPLRAEELAYPRRADGEQQGRQPWSGVPADQQPVEQREERTLR